MTFPVAPQVKSFAQMLRAQLNKMTQQPHEGFEILGLFLFSNLVNLVAETLDPNVAIVNIAERGLQLSRALSVSRYRSSPALLKQLDRVSQPLRGNTHLVESFDFGRPEQSTAEFLQLLQPVENNCA